jgi:FkbH-like protein
MLQEHALDLGSATDDFLERAESVLTLSFDKTGEDPRVLDLINKTNQFNLNGKRYTESDLSRYLMNPASFLLKVNYSDKYGPLGKILIMLGRNCGTTLLVDAWVMSCRAFSRRIEYACLDHIFTKFAANELVFDFVATERNKPLQDFFGELPGTALETGLRLSRDQFKSACPRLYHQVENEKHG